MFKIESSYLLKNPTEIIIIKDKIFDPNSGILIFYQDVSSKTVSNRVCINQDLLMIRKVRELYFIQQNNKRNRNSIYKHVSNQFSAIELKDELVIFSKKENLFLFLRGYNNKLNDLGKLFNPNQTLSENLTSAIKSGTVARDAHYGLLAISLLDKNSQREIFEISKIF